MRQVYDIGALRLDANARVLTHAGAPVALGARGVAVLAALVSRAGEHVPKADIMDAAWPGLVVEEANLAVQISAIRRALACVPGGEGWIETLARRGYRFVGPVTAMAAHAPDASVLSDRTRTNLPQVLTSFVGRERELAQIKQLLPTTRLLTVTGTGGIGKTRLALQAAAEVRDAYRDGVWFVDLAPLLDPALVPSALAQVLGVKESAQQPLSKSLSNFLRDKELLLLFDNCEHVLGATAELVDALLRDTAHVSIVATSRESLRVAAEKTYPLGVLPLPDPKASTTAIARSDAVQLFVDRARQHRPRFDLDGTHAPAVAAICVRLDGLPLALELAAARVAVLPVEEIVRLLDQRFRLLTRGSRSEVPRQQTLRAMIDWSYDLLDEAEKQLFARLSVFAGGWTIAAAEAVGAGEPIARDDVVYLLIALIEKSLVVADENGDRYRMLETVREYARERLTQGGSTAAVGRRHLDFFVALGEEAEPRLKGADQQVWFDRLEIEHDNLRAALTRSTASDEDAVAGLRLAGAVARLWSVRGYARESRRWFATLLATAGDIPPSARAKALSGVTGAARLLGEFQAAKASAEECLALWRSLGDRHGIAGALSDLGLIHRDLSDGPTARVLLLESLALRREIDDRWGIAASLNNLGLAECEAGEFDTARLRHQEALVIRREISDLWGIGASLSNLAYVASNQSDTSTARAFYEEGLTIFRRLGERSLVASILNSLALQDCVEGNYADVRPRFDESLALRRELGDRRGIAASLYGISMVDIESGDYASARSLLAEALTIRRDMGDQRVIAESLDGFAYLASLTGDHLAAARIWGASDRLRERIGNRNTAHDAAVRKDRLNAGRTALGDAAALDHAWEEGRAMPLDEAIEFALHMPIVR